MFFYSMPNAARLVPVIATCPAPVLFASRVGRRPFANDRGGSVSWFLCSIDIFSNPVES